MNIRLYTSGARRVLVWTTEMGCIVDIHTLCVEQEHPEIVRLGLSEHCLYSPMRLPQFRGQPLEGLQHLLWIQFQDNGGLYRLIST